MICRIKLSRKAQKQLKRVPGYIVDLLEAWVEDVEHRGIEEVRKLPGLHDEPLKGKRKGQRSFRLTRSWRAFYVIQESGDIEFLEVLEVNKHEY